MDRLQENCLLRKERKPIVSTTGNQRGLLKCRLQHLYHTSSEMHGGKRGHSSSAVELDLTPSGPDLRCLLRYSQAWRDKRPELSG